MKKSLLIFITVLVVASSGATLAAPPATFEQAKIELRQKVYFDRNSAGDLYCGCPWQWMGRSGGCLDLQTCGYQVRAPPTRAARIEWEHISRCSGLGARPPAAVLAEGRARQLLIQRPGIPGHGGRHAQPVSISWRGERRSRQLPLRPAHLEALPVWHLSDPRGLQAANGGASRQG